MNQKVQLRTTFSLPRPDHGILLNVFFRVPQSAFQHLQYVASSVHPQIGFDKAVQKQEYEMRLLSETVVYLKALSKAAGQDVSG